jgi:hypothetical protein
VPGTASIIINNYNYGRFLRQCIESAVSQSRAAQVIVVDDGSTDDSVEVIRSYGARIYPILKENGGQASAVNAGFAAATGEVVFVLDSDDVLERNAVEEVLTQWQPSTVMGHYAMTIIDADGAPIGVHPDPPEDLDEGDVVPSLLRTGRFRSTVTSGLAFSREALAQCLPVAEPLYRESVDGYLLRCVAFLGKVQRIHGRLARYRSHGSNISNVAVDPERVADSCRRRIAIVRNELNVVREQSEKYRHPTPNAELGEDDPYFLSLRLFSQILGPAQHPVPGDRRLALLIKYVRAAALGFGAWQTRVFRIALACAAVAAPTPVATKCAVWHLDPRQRPKHLRSLARVVRRARERMLASESA